MRYLQQRLSGALDCDEALDQPLIIISRGRESVPPCRWRSLRPSRSTRTPEPAASNRQWKPPPNELTLVDVTAYLVASASGLAAFKSFLVRTPADSGMVFVPVQHLAPSHPIALTEKQGRATKMPLMEFRDEPTVEPWCAIE